MAKNFLRNLCVTDFLIPTLFLFLAFQSCTSSLTDYATDWSNDVKAKIIEDANQPADKIVIDSASYTLTLFRGDKKLKFYQLKPRFDDIGELQYVDTTVSIFFSTDQNFELVRELCPVVDRSFEGIRYKGEHLGLAEFKYCDGTIKMRGFRFKGNIGIWREYDNNGQLLKETDHGNIQRLENLKKIQYYR